MPKDACHRATGGVPAAPLRETHTAVIARLEALLIIRQHEHDVLVVQNRQLRAHATIATVTVQQSEAVAHLVNAQLGKGATCGCSHPQGQACSKNVSTPSACYEQQIEELQQQLAPVPAPLSARSPSLVSSGYMSSGGDNNAFSLDTNTSSHSARSSNTADSGCSEQRGSSSANDRAAPVQTRAPVSIIPDVSIGWAAAVAAQELVSSSFWAARGLEAGDSPSETLQRHIKEFIARSAPLTPRVRHSAPDADSARQALQQLRAKVLQHVAAAAVMAMGAPATFVAGCSPLGSSAVAAATLDCTSSAAAAQDGSWDSQMSLDMPRTESFMWAVDQMQLDPEQESLVRVLLEKWRSRTSQLAAGFDALMQHYLAPSGAALQQWPDRCHQEGGWLLGRLRGLRDAYLFNHMVFVLSLYGSILRPEQLAAFKLAGLPHLQIPVLPAVEQALCKSKSMKD